MGIGRSRYERPSPICDAHLSLKNDGQMIVEECHRRNFHSGRHETREGASWELGREDYKPVDR